VARTSAPEALPAASLPEALGVLVTGVLPALIRGLFSPRPWAMRVLTRLNADRRLVSVLSGVRSKRDGQGVRLLGGRIVVLWGEEAIREVLDYSATVYDAGSGAKAKGMRHFQPDALTLSHGEEWRDRRAFTDYVLASGDRTHPCAPHFVAAIEDELDRLAVAGTLDWRHWEQLFDRITLRVMFGDEARTDTELTAQLERLMAESNRLVGLKRGDRYIDFYSRLERRLAQAGEHSLAARAAEAPQSPVTDVPHQFPHWMFAMRDTLAANAFRALAVIVADPSRVSRARSDGDYLEGCLHEAMRLWPTTPLLAREAVQDATVAGTRIPEGTQLMLLNVFSHRDAAHVDRADEFVPERWLDRAPDYRFNHLSNGSQDCPGGPLVLLLGSAVVAGVLNRYDLALTEPQIPARGSLPHMLNFFETRFTARSRGS
jgi:cytochrome P450